MARKYKSSVTAKLTADNWQEIINLKTMSRDDMLDLFGDMKAMEKLGKKIQGFMREALIARMPKGESSQENNNFSIEVTESSGRVTLDGARILEDMGEQFVQKYSNTGEDFVTVKLKVL